MSENAKIGRRGTKSIVAHAMTTCPNGCKHPDGSPRMVETDGARIVLDGVITDAGPTWRWEDAPCAGCGRFFTIELYDAHMIDVNVTLDPEAK